MAFADIILADSPKHFWRLNETSGTNAVDLGTAATTTTYHGGFTLNQASLLVTDPTAASVLLNGTTGDVETGAVTLSNTAFSAWSWVNLTAVTGGNQRAFAYQNVWGFGVNSSGKFLVTFFSVADNASTASVPLKCSTHLGVSWDGTSIRYYINGTKVQTLAATAPSGSGANALTIGSTGGGADWWGGRIGDTAEFDVVLTDNQFYNHYLAGVASPRSPYQVGA